MNRSSFVTGVRDIAPTLPANISVGLLFGASAMQVGIKPSIATVFSILAVSARAQLAVVKMIQEGASFPVLIVTVVLINLRYLTFSAALAPKIKNLSRLWRAIIAHPLMDITYAFADARFSRDKSDRLHRGWYFLGINIPWVAMFGAGTLLGAIVGQTIGTELHLQFMIPLVFIGLMVSQIESTAGFVAAIAGGVAAIIGAGLPFNLGLLAGGLVGAGIGGFVDMKMHSGYSREDRHSGEF